METIEVLIFDHIAGGMENYRDKDLEIGFCQVDPHIGKLSFDSGAWAFVDWDTPTLSGLEICRRLRCNPGTTRIRITLALEELDKKSKRLAAQAGANDYIRAPITHGAIIEKVKAHFSHRSPMPPGELRYGDLVVDHSVRKAYWKNKSVVLMPNQLRLLCFLIENPGQVFTRIQLIEALGDLDMSIDERTVDVWVGRLRRALRAVGAGDLLRTVRSRGYVLERSRRHPSTAKPQT